MQTLEKLGMIEVYDYFNKMNEDNVMLAFKGGITSDLLSSLLQIAENKLEKETDKPKVKKKVFNVLVECFQNVYHHFDKPMEGDISNSAILMVGKEDDFFVIMTGNYIEREKVESLQEKIDFINSLDKEQLKNVYREVLNNDQISDKGGAGLGMIDIVRRSGQKIVYDFQPVSDMYSYFSLQIRVSVD